MNRYSAILTLFLLCAGCVRERAVEKPPLPVTVQPVAAVAPAGVQTGLASRYSAVLGSRELVNLAFKVTGYVDFLAPGALDKGSPVKKGQVLARVREADYKAKLAQARSTLAEAQASLELARSDQERNAKLIAGNVISRSEFDRTRERLGVAQAKADQARAALEQAEINLRDTSLVSPMDGVVVRRDVEIGTLAGQGAAFVLADLSSVKAVFGLPDQDIVRVKPGDTLSIAADALPGRTFSGTVTSVSPSADPKSRTFDVEVTIPNQDMALKDGMIATVSREPVPGKAMLAAVPLHALARPAGNGSFLVHVLAEKDGRTFAQARTVTVSGVTGDMVTLASGLRPGEMVITRGATLAADGLEVRVIR